MPGGSKASWTGYELVWGILAADEEYSPAHRFDGEAKSFVVVLEEPQKIAQRTRASKNVDVLSVEM